MQIAVLVLGSLFAIVGLFLFVKQAGGGSHATVNLPGGVGVSGVAPGILIFLVGALLIYVAAGTQVLGDTPGDPAENSGDVAHTVAIDAPNYRVIAKGDGESNLRADGELWTYTIGGAAAGPAEEPRPSVYLLYRAKGETGAWQVQGMSAVNDKGLWKANGWIQQSAFTEGDEHEFELRPLVTRQQLEQSGNIAADLKSVAAPDASDGGTNLTYDAVSEPVLLTMRKPE